MILTFSDGTSMNVLDHSNANVIHFEYNGETLISIIESLTYERLCNATLQLFDDNNNMLKTEIIVKRKFNDVKIEHGIVTVTLRKITPTEETLQEISDKCDGILQMVLELQDIFLLMGEDLDGEYSEDEQLTD